jgi:prophage regulatory protein
MFNSAPGGVNMVNIILRLPTVKIRTGLSRSSIYLRMSNNEFPSSISLGGRSVGWLESDIESWLDEKILSSQSAGK